MQISELVSLIFIASSALENVIVEYNDQDNGNA